MSLTNLQRGWYLFVEILAIMYGASLSLIAEHSNTLEYNILFGIFAIMWSMILLLFLVGKLMC